MYIQYGTRAEGPGRRVLYYFVGCVWLEVQTRPPPPLACVLPQPQLSCQVIALPVGRSETRAQQLQTTGLGINDKPPAPGPAPRALLDRVGGRAGRQAGHSHTGCGHRILYSNPRLASPHRRMWVATFHLGLHSQTMAPWGVFIGSKSVTINLRIVRINALWWS